MTQILSAIASQFGLLGLVVATILLAGGWLIWRVFGFFEKQSDRHANIISTIATDFRASIESRDVRMNKISDEFLAAIKDTAMINQRCIGQFPTVEEKIDRLSEENHEEHKELMRLVGR